MGFEQHCKNLDLQVKQTGGGFNVIQTTFRRATGLPSYCTSARSLGRNQLEIPILPYSKEVSPKGQDIVLSLLSCKADVAFDFVQDLDHVADDCLVQIVYAK